jgi:hydroxyacylglutathione hydrolase
MPNQTQTLDKNHHELAPHFYWIPGDSGWIHKFSSHSYVFEGGEKTILIDPGSSRHVDVLKYVFKGLSRQPDLTIVTHEHWDHIVAVDTFPDSEKAASRHALEALNGQQELVVRHGTHEESYTSKFTRGLDDGEVINVAPFQLEILLTPGHTGGSLCIYEPNLKILITGDTFFAQGSISRVFPEAGGGRDLHVQTLKRIQTLAKERGLDSILPGHGELIEGKQNCLDSIELSLKRAEDDLL